MSGRRLPSAGGGPPLRALTAAGDRSSSTLCLHVQVDCRGRCGRPAAACALHMDPHKHDHLLARGHDAGHGADHEWVRPLLPRLCSRPAAPAASPTPRHSSFGGGEGLTVSHERARPAASRFPFHGEAEPTPQAPMLTSPISGAPTRPSLTGYTSPTYSTQGSRTSAECSAPSPSSCSLGWPSSSPSCPPLALPSRGGCAQMCVACTLLHADGRRPLSPCLPAREKTTAGPCQAGLTLLGSHPHPRPVSLVHPVFTPRAALLAWIRLLPSASPSCPPARVEQPATSSASLQM